MSTRGFIGYKHNCEIRGTFNHWDSYMDGCGEDMLDKYCALTQEQLRVFFLKRWSLRPREEEGAIDGEQLRRMDWAQVVEGDETIAVSDNSVFIKDGLFCEYGYVFDLDSKKKRLMFFEGFGKKPSKGYEDYFYDGVGDKPGTKERYHEVYVGSITGDLDREAAEYKARTLFARPKLKKFLQQAERVPLEEVPLLVGRAKELMDDPDEDDWIVPLIEGLMKRRLSAA